MKQQKLKRVTPEDLQGTPEAIEALEPLLQAMNTNSDTIEGALRGGPPETRDIFVVHNTPLEIELKKLKTAPETVLAYPELFDYFKLKWRNSRPGRIEVVLSFDSAPTDRQKVRLVCKAST